MSLNLYICLVDQILQKEHVPCGNRKENKKKKIMLLEGEKEKKKELFGLGFLIDAIWH